MTKNKKEPRSEYYWTQVKKHGQKYKEFNWSSVEMLLNLVYSYDVISNNLAQKIAPYGITKAGFSVLMVLLRS